MKRSILDRNTIFSKTLRMIHDQYARGELTDSQVYTRICQTLPPRATRTQRVRTHAEVTARTVH